MSNQEYDTVVPEPESILQSLRAFGYSIETAIADLVDNSISAHANTILISFGIDKHNEFVRIEDNGIGMSESDLVKAMKIGSLSPLVTRDVNDLGRFGLGLKTASFSQCKRLSVRSKKEDKIFTRVWDLDIVSDKKEWCLLREAVSQKSEKNIASISQNSGTIVLWETLDRLIESGDFIFDKQELNRKIENLRVHLGLIFHRFIEEGKVLIFVGDNKVEAVNPFVISENQPTRELGLEVHSIDDSNISIQPYILPHESKLTAQEIAKLQISKGWNEHQGIYLYRSKRLISEGTWLDLPFRKKESQRLARIQIDLPNTLDKEWQIDVRKASAKVPDVLRNALKRICASTISEAIRVYTHRGAYLRRQGQRKEIVYLWKARQKQGKRYYEINKEHPIYQLIAEYLEDDAYIFNDYIKLIGESLPINFIVSDFSDPSMMMKDFFEGTKGDLKAIYQNTILALVGAGLTEKEAIEKANRIECFQQLIIN